MKTTKDFIDYYNSFYHNIIDITYQKEVQKYQKKYQKVLIQEIILFFLFIACFFVWYKKYLDFSLILIIFLFVGFILLTIINIKYLFGTLKETKYFINYIIYKDILSYISDDNYYFNYKTQLSQEDFEKMNLFNLNLLNYTGENFTASSYLNKKFLFYDIELYDLVERIKTDKYYDSKTNTDYITNYHYHDKVDIFKGLYYETTINRDNDEYIYLIPNNIKDKFLRNNINHYISYQGNIVELENLDFSNKYSVFSLDENKSRYVLSLTFMEKINELDRLIPNKKYLVFKNDGRVSLFIENFLIENLFLQEFSINNKEISQEYLIKYFEKVLKLFQISDVLEDINSFNK